LAEGNQTGLGDREKKNKMRFQINPTKPSSGPEDLLWRADTLIGDEQSKGLQGVIAEKLEKLQHYDVLAMDRVAAILMWGRSGSLLLASYLDGHEDVMMLPELYDWKLYDFLERCRPLPLRDKLGAYPVFDPGYNRF
jgi:hypothetical protein